MQFSIRSLYLCFSLLAVCGVVFATEVAPYDCSSYASYTSPEAYANAVYQALTPKVFTKQDLQTAVRFLQHACCEEFNQKDADNSICATLTLGQEYYPQSPYIFDQLISIGMRKLDGKEEDCKTLRIDCMMQNGDEKAVERRNKITEIAEDSKGYPPSVIQEYFRTYWGDVSNPTDQSLLANQYYTMCDEVQQIREAIGINAADIDAQLTNGMGLAGYCYRVAQQRYGQEVAYVRSLMAQKAVQYHQQNISAYVKTYFVDNRLADLLDKFITLDGCFTMVLKYISRTSCCNY